MTTTGQFFSNPPFTPMIDHPITPPPELVRQWLGEFFGCTGSCALSHSENYLATQAARWGADQELEACCNAIYEHEEQPLSGGTAEWLRAARRPQPPSLKQQALDDLRSIETCFVGGDLVTANIRRAVEALPDA